MLHAGRMLEGTCYFVRISRSSQQLFSRSIFVVSVWRGGAQGNGWFTFVGTFFRCFFAALDRYLFLHQQESGSVSGETLLTYFGSFHILVLVGTGRLCDPTIISTSYVCVNIIYSSHSLYLELQTPFACTYDSPRWMIMLRRALLVSY